MEQYVRMLRRVLDEGVLKHQGAKVRGKAVKTMSVFGHWEKFDLRLGFPLVTTKKTKFEVIMAELLWFLSGSTSNQDLHDLGATIWDEWAKDGSLGPIYGKQWRKWEGPKTTHDQIATVINNIKTVKADPQSRAARRLVVSAWNVADLDAMSVQPCHAMFQFNVTDGVLSCLMFQRSADAFLGVPFNIASYAALTHMVAQVTGLGVGTLQICFGDLHIYENHIESAKEVVKRAPLALPRLVLNKSITDIDAFRTGDIRVEDYTSHPAVRGEVAVLAMLLSIVAATDLHWVIGKNGKLPWHLPGDLQRFKTRTMGKPVIVGRRTIEGIGRGFPGRKTIVLTHSRALSFPGCDMVSSFSEACGLAEATGAEEAMVIGGAQVYQQAFDVADRLYLTLVLGTFEGDSFFPNPFESGRRKWELKGAVLHPADERNRWSCVDLILDAAEPAVERSDIWCISPRREAV